VVDYARVLISTSSLDIIKTGAKVLVDGDLFDFNIIEEWGFALRDDACLDEADESQVDDELQQDGEHNEVATNGDVDVLLNHLSEEWHKEDSVHFVRPSPSINILETVKVTFAEKESSAAASLGDHTSASVGSEVQRNVSGRQQSDINIMIDIGSPQQADNVVNSQKDVQGGASKSRHSLSGGKRPIKRTAYCPSGRAHTVTVGPWSLDWFDRHKCVTNGDEHSLKSKEPHKQPSSAPRAFKKKGSGYIRHCAQNLKRIARLSEKDQKEVLCALRKTHKSRKGNYEVSKKKVIVNESSS